MRARTRGFSATTEGHTTALTLAAVTALLDLADRSVEGGVEGLVRRQPFVQGYVETIAAWLPDGISWESRSSGGRNGSPRWRGRPTSRCP